VNAAETYETVHLESGMRCHSSGTATTARQLPRSGTGRSLTTLHDLR